MGHRLEKTLSRNMSKRMKLKVPIPFWLLIVAFACLAPLDGRAWDIRDIMDPEKENLLRNPAYDILVITMLAVEDEHATNGNPPKVQLSVEEVIRSEKRTPTVTATWQAPVFHEDLKEAGGVTDAWKRRPLKGPEVGTKLIVFSIGPASSAGIQAWSVYRFSPENRATAIEHAARERSASIQIPLFLLLLVLPALIAILFIRSYSPKISQRVRLRLRQVVAILACTTVGLYFFYESGISVYSNIRIDLNLVWPALGAAFMIGILSVIQLLFGSGTSLREATPAGGLLTVLGGSLAWGLGIGAAACVVAIAAPVILGGSAGDLGMLATIVVGPHALIIGIFVALLYQIRRVLALPMRSKATYGLILLLLLFPTVKSVVSLSSFAVSIGGLLS